MKCSVFIATSADGFIAKLDGSVDWLHTSGNQSADMKAHGDMGFSEFMASVDCMIMGRKSMEVISSFNLTPDQWPYGDINIYALSNTIHEAPDNLNGKVEMYSGDLNELVSSLEEKGHNHAYIDGGKTIQTFLNLELLNELTISRAPILLGEGIPLFGKMKDSLALEQAQVKSYPNDFIQVKYKVRY